MATIQLRRSCFLSTTAASSSSSSLSFFPTMAKMQYQVFQNCGATSLPSARFKEGDKFRKFSQISFRNTGMPALVNGIQPKIPKLSVNRNFHSFPSVTHSSQFQIGFSNAVTPMYTSIYGILDIGIRFSSPHYRVLAKMPFSQVSRVKSKCENLVVRDGTAKNTLPLDTFRMHRRQKKSLAAYRRSFIVGYHAAVSKQPTKASSLSSRRSALVSDKMLTQEDQLVDNVRKDADFSPSISTSSVSNKKQGSKSTEKERKQSRSKKNKVQITSTSASSDVAPNESTESSSHAKNFNITKTSQSAQASKSSSTGNEPVDVPDSSVSTEKQSKKATATSNKKGKSREMANRSPKKQMVQRMGKINNLEQKPLKKLYPPSGKSVVVVESVTKAKVIQGYLGDMYEVLPSYGHVRDLAARSGSVRPDDDFSMVWEVPSASWTHLKSIKVALSRAENLILASDPDREGEAISWHIIEMLLQQGALHSDLTVARVVFHEITESSIKSALETPREIDVNLVHAYLARRALDYLIGFNISPILWRKLPGCQSAGRVQSAALSIICDREMEIDEFKPLEYWTVEVEFKTKHGSSMNTNLFPSYLTHFNSKKLNQLSISSYTEAKDIKQEIDSLDFKVIGSKRNKMRKNPPAPYITSTLQQEAANKLHFTAMYTMKLAQKLYEGVQLSDGKAAGLITYMRTDGLHVSDEAVKDIRSLITERYGSNFASDGGHKYFKKVKNAQEAHEAIRPTDIRRIPSMLAGLLDEDSLKLYTLIWSRTMACQMEPATIDQVQVDIGNANESVVFRSTCSGVEFFGYQAVYKDVEAKAIRVDGNEENERGEVFKLLSSLKAGDPLCLNLLELKQHQTLPPPRYSEGALVKKLEELGIGRPSTYATTMKVLKDRKYVTVKNRVFYPEFRGRMVTAFLSDHFSEVTDYSFTADMETELDNVSAGLTEWKGLLKDYWTRFSMYCNRVSNVHIHQVEKMLEKKFGDFLFSFLAEKSRTCPSCMEGTLIFKVSRYGSGYFIGCDQHPKCKYIAKMIDGDDEDDEEEEEDAKERKIREEPKVLGVSPGSREKVLLKGGPYGFYVQLGEDRKGYSPKRSSVSHIKDVNSVTLEDALELLRYPITLGNHPNDDQPILLKLAKNGFTIRHRRTIAPVPKKLNPNDITLEKALKLLLSKAAKQSGRPKNKKREDVYEAV